jgi:hypothetical protein
MTIAIALITIAVGLSLVIAAYANWDFCRTVFDFEFAEGVGVLVFGGR